MYTASEEPPDYTVCLHNEMACLPTWPKLVRLAASRGEDRGSKRRGRKAPEVNLSLRRPALCTEDCTGKSNNCPCSGIPRAGPEVLQGPTDLPFISGVTRFLHTKEDNSFTFWGFRSAIQGLVLDPQEHWPVRILVMLVPCWCCRCSFSAKSLRPQRAAGRAWSPTTGRSCRGWTGRCARSSSAEASPTTTTGAAAASASTEPGPRYGLHFSATTNSSNWPHGKKQVLFKSVRFESDGFCVGVTIPLNSRMIDTPAANFSPFAFRHDIHPGFVDISCNEVSSRGLGPSSFGSKFAGPTGPKSLEVDDVVPNHTP